MLHGLITTLYCRRLLKFILEKVEIIKKNYLSLLQKWNAMAFLSQIVFLGMQGHHRNLRSKLACFTFENEKE